MKRKNPDPNALSICLLIYHSLNAKPLLMTHIGIIIIIKAIANT